MVSDLDSATSHVHPDAVASDKSSSADRVSCAVCCAAVITQATLAVAPNLSAEQPSSFTVPATPERNPGGIERPPRLVRR